MSSELKIASLDEIRNLLGSVLSSSVYNVHEEELNDEFWTEKQIAYKNAVEKLLSAKLLLRDLPPRSFCRLLLFVAGCLGNAETTNKLCSVTIQLQVRCNQLLDEILDFYDAKDVFHLLVTDLNRSDESKFDKLMKEASLFLPSAPTSSNDSSSFTKAPLIRDAIIWTTCRVKYPLLSDTKQLSYLNPFSLQLLEDYRISVKIAGLNLLRHLAANILTSSWRSTGRAEATLSVLLTQRSSYAFTTELLEASWDCIFEFLRLLDFNQNRQWSNRVADVILCDLTLESNLEKRIVLLHFVSRIIELLKTEMMVHSRRLLKAAEFTLLAPRSPSSQIQFQQRERVSFTRMLDCLLRFAQLVTTELFPDIVQILLPVLVAFVDLEWNRASGDEVAFQKHLQLLTPLVVSILDVLCSPYPVEMFNIMQACSDSVPPLKELLLDCKFLHCSHP